MDPRLLMSRMTERGKARMTEGTSVEDDRKESLELADPAHFHEVAFEVEELRVGFAHLVGKRDLGAEPEHRDRAIEQRGLQDAGLVLAGGIVGHKREPLALVIRPPELAAQAHGKSPTATPRSCPPASSTRHSSTGEPWPPAADSPPAG